MKVTIRELGPGGQPKVIGTFTLVEGRIVADPPDDNLLRNILTEEVLSHETGEIIDPKTHPKEWLEELHKFFDSPYLSASKPG